MAFIEERLLDCVAYGTQGGPTWLTRRVPLKNGRVKRNPLRSRPLYRFQVIYRNLLRTDHEHVIQAFNACFGGAHAFRLKDWSDYTATNELLSATGTGAPQTLQLRKLYTFGTQTVARPIRKPVDEGFGVVVTANNVPISSTTDYTTGLVTFTATSGHVLRWSGEFDVPVYFLDDELSFSFEDRNEAEGFFLTADVGLEEDTSA